MRRDPEDRLREIEWPAPDATLRERILADAPTPASSITWSDRIWYSRMFRWSVGAVAVALIVVAQWPDSDMPVGFQPAESALAEAQAVENVVLDAGLPYKAAESLTRRSLAGKVFHQPARTMAILQAIETGGGQ